MPPNNWIENLSKGVEAILITSNYANGLHHVVATIIYAHLDTPCKTNS
jgi:hypothetical protein